MSMYLKANFWGRFMGAIGKNTHYYFKIALDNSSLKKAEIMFLNYICREKNVEQSSLTDFFHVDKSTTTRKIKKLIKLNYIKRTTDPEDHRKYLLKPTEKGINLHKDFHKVFSIWHEELTKGLSNEEKMQFKNIAEKIIINSNSVIERMKDHE